MFPYLTALKVAGIVALLLSTSYCTHQYDMGQEALRLQEQRQQLLAKNEKLEDEIQKLTEDYVTKAENVRIITKTIIKEIPKVLTDDVDAMYPVSNGFVRLHDSAASGVLIPEDTSRIDANPSEIKESEVAGTVADNYESCNVTREKLIALQKIIKTMTENGKPNSSD